MCEINDIKDILYLITYSALTTVIGCHVEKNYLLRQRNGFLQICGDCKQYKFAHLGSGICHKAIIGPGILPNSTIETTCNGALYDVKDVAKFCIGKKTKRIDAPIKDIEVQEQLILDFTKILAGYIDIN